MFSLYFYDFKVKYHFKPQHIIGTIDIGFITAACLYCCHAVVLLRLKELLLKERSECSDLHARVEELEGRCQSLTQQLDHARSKEEQHKSTLHRLEESISQGEAIRSRQQTEEVLWLI